MNTALTWMTPYIGNSKWRFGYELSWSKSSLESEDYNLKTVGVSLFASYPITNYWTFGTKERIKYIENRVKKKVGTEASEEGNTRGLISAPSFSFDYNSTDSPLHAHKGLHSYWETEMAGAGGKYKFLKFSLINTLYQHMWKNGTMKYRANVIFIQPIMGQSVDDVPLSERLFLGGETSVRGYKPYCLGPHYDHRSRDPKGGVTSSLLTVEYDHELLSMLSIFIFADAGSISEKTFSIAKLRASTGAGIRLTISNKMPMMVGWGYPINPQRRSDKQGIFFSMEGKF